MMNDHIQTAPHIQISSFDKSRTVNFMRDRQPERSSNVFSRLLQKSTIYGVNDQFASEVLQNLSITEIVSSLEELLTNPQESERVARQSYLHANGFYKLVIFSQAQAKVRLHYWRDDQAAEENIHNHRWMLASRVLFGELSSEIYKQCSPEDSDALMLETRRYHKQFGQLGAEGEVLGRQSVRLCTRNTRFAGESYALDMNTLHRITRPNHSTPTLTLMIQSCPVYEDNYMLSFDHVKEPELVPNTLSVEELSVILREIINHLHSHKA